MRLFDTIAPLPWREGRCKKIGLVPFHVILANPGSGPGQVPESSGFMGLEILWTPVFTCLREAASAKAGRGDQYSVIFSQPQGIEGRGIKVSEL
jgi:hypothetical protein